jgi:putative SOS response-associated peptidase YedK
MCGRFVFYSPAEAVTRLFGVEFEQEFQPRYNIAPTQVAPVLRRDDAGSRRLTLLRWGLVPFWAKDRAIGNRMINARAETVAAKPAFRQAYRRRRCLVLADGFYEWQRKDAGKVPWYIHSTAGGPFAMAGLWERWRPEGEESLETFTILTREADPWMTAIHHRMPVIVDGDTASRWLDPATGEQALNSVCEGPTGVELEATQVSRQVNNPGNEGPELIQPVGN